MPIAQMLLPECDVEMAITRRVLERVPSEKGEWKPHPKSFPMAHLAQLVSRMPSWATTIMPRPRAGHCAQGRPGGPGYKHRDHRDAAGRVRPQRGAGARGHRRGERRRLRRAMDPEGGRARKCNAQPLPHAAHGDAEPPCSPPRAARRLPAPGGRARPAPCTAPPPTSAPNG